MNQMQQQVQQQQGNPAPSPVPFVRSHPKAPALPSFNGTMGFEVDSWIRSLKKQFDFYGAHSFPDDIAKIKFASAYLESYALEWWERLPPSDRDGLTTLDAFEALLHQRWRPKLAAEVARQRISALKQKGTVSSLCNLFLILLAHVPTMHEDDKIFHFKRALDRPIAAKVAESKPKSLHEAMDAAVQAELYVGRNNGSNLSRPNYNPHLSSSSSSSTPMDINALEDGSDEVDPAGEKSASTPPPPPSSSTQPSMSPSEIALRQEIQQLQNTSKQLINALQSSNPSRSNQGNNNPPRNNDRIQPLRDGEKEKLMKEGRCFRCRETGHQANNCPRFRSNKNNKRLNW